MQRQVFWLSGHHHFASLPELLNSVAEWLQNDSLITAAGAAPELMFAS
jgi:hypothetical protein